MTSKFPFPSNGIAHLNTAFLSPCTPGAKNPKTKREQDGALFSVKFRRKIAGTPVPLDPNAIFMHDTSETPAAQRFVVNLGTTGGDGVHRVWPLDVNDTTNRTKCQIFLEVFYCLLEDDGGGGHVDAIFSETKRSVVPDVQVFA